MKWITWLKNILLLLYVGTVSNQEKITSGKAQLFYIKKNLPPIHENKIFYLKVGHLIQHQKIRHLGIKLSKITIKLIKTCLIARNQNKHKYHLHRQEDSVSYLSILFKFNATKSKAQQPFFHGHWQIDSKIYTEKEGAKNRECLNSYIFQT